MKDHFGIIREKAALPASCTRKTYETLIECPSLQLRLVTP